MHATCIPKAADIDKHQFRTQLGASLGENDWRWHCERSYEMRLAGGRVHLFFIDTNPFVQRYYQTEWANFTGAPRPCFLLP